LNGVRYGMVRIRRGTESRHDVDRLAEGAKALR
jgi:hypothetical protein